MKVSTDYMIYIDLPITIECVHDSHVGARNNAIFLQDKKTQDDKCIVLSLRDCVFFFREYSLITEVVMGTWKAIKY